MTVAAASAMPAPQAFPSVPISPEAAAFLVQAQDRGLFIANAWAPLSGTEEPICVFDPATGTAIATVAACGAQDVDAAVAAARAAFDDGAWPALPATRRAEILHRIADGLTAKASLLAELETLDNGMPLASARAMVGGAAAIFRYYAGWCGKVYGETMEVETWDPGSEVTAFTRSEAVGVVGQILPWNFPLAICAMKLAPALAAGCTVVVKPAEETPLSALALAEICRDSGLPAGVLGIVTGHGEVAGSALVAHPGVDKVSFTGSTEVGRLILSAAAGNMKKVSLELGGKAPFIVLPDADIEKAALAAVRGAFGNQGQNCTSAARLLVHADIAEAFTCRVVELTRSLDVGPGMSDATVGPLVSARHLERVLGYVEIGQAEGATLAAGGERIGTDGYFMRPAVFTGVGADMRIMREEIFGPLVPIQTFDTNDIAQIAALANDTPYGLLASVWTHDLATAHKLTARIRAGTVSVNAHSHPGINAPFGGFKQSGWGREFGRAAMEAYLETKTIAFHV